VEKVFGQGKGKAQKEVPEEVKEVDGHQGPQVAPGVEEEARHASP
jgi:hypothetical protein